MMVLGGYTDVPPILTSPTPMQEGVNLSPTHHHAIQSLEKEFILVKHHLKQLVLKKARRLREIHRHKRHKSGYSSEQCTIVKLHWKCSSQGSFYYRSDPTVDKLSGISLFSSLPNEVLLHIFSYLGVTHLCKSLMHVCALFSVIALDESLWRPLYHQHWGFHMPRITEKDGTVSWRYRFTQQSLTESNWWRGCYNVHTLEGHKVSNIHAIHPAFCLLHTPRSPLVPQPTWSNACVVGGCTLHAIFWGYACYRISR